MTRRLFGILLVALAVIAGYLYHVRIQPPARAPEEPRVEAARAPAGGAVQAVAAGVAPSMAATDTPAIAPTVKDGRLLAKLPNGLTVLVVEDRRFPLVSERLYVRAGSAYEAKGQEGISHLLEHMVFNSTAKRPKGGVAHDIESAGGDVNASTSFDYTQYMADLPSAKWRLGLDVFQDMIFGAKFDPAELEQEKKVVISELERGQDEPGRRLFQMSQAQAWRSLPYRYPVIGYRETVNAVSSGDLSAYVKRLYQPQSMLLVVVGDVDAREIFDQARSVFGSLADDRAVIPPDIRNLPVNLDGPTASAAGGNWNKCYLRLNFAVPGMHSAKDAPLEVLADLLGGQKNSKLYRKLVYEEQLADDLDVSSTTLERGGMFSIEATLDPAKVDAFWTALTAELARLKASDFSAQELGRVKLDIEDTLYRARETLAGLATKLAYYQFFGFGQEGEANEIYTVRNTEAEQLQGLLDAYIQPGNASLSLLVPGQDQAGAEAKAQSMLERLEQIWPARARPEVSAETGGAAKAPEVIDLGGGRVVVLLADPTMPYASVTLTYRGGDSLLAPDQQGLGELSASALTRSTLERAAPGMEDFLADRASAVSASCGRDTFTVSARYPARFSNDMTGLLAEVALEPAFAKEEVERAKRMQLARIAETGDRPTGLAFRHLFPFLYPGGYYGYFRAGQPEQVAAYTPEDARSFWEKQRTMPWVLAVCGVFDRQAILDLASSLAVAPEGSAKPFPDPAWSQNHEMSLKLAERNQTHLFWIFPVPGRQSPDTPALEVLKSALAGQGGLLFKELRDKHGLGYSVTAFLWQAPKTGFLAFYIGTTPDKEAQAMEEFKRVATELADKGLDDALIERAKNSLEGDYYDQRQSLRSRSDEAAQNLAMGYPLDLDRELLVRERALTGPQIAEAAKKYLDQSKTYLLRIEP